MNQDVLEIQEAIMAGEEAVQYLEEARKELKTAKGLGLWDIFGGGIIASLMKRDRMGRAQDKMDIAQRKLQEFSKELRDISDSNHFDLGMDDLTGTFDILFDNMFMDIMVQSKINNAANKVDEAIDRVNEILDELEELLERALESE